ncbi:MAG: PEP-CTERM system TPR-repeat protein PrsT [Gammaproteobacteria bacterium]|nr:PEP-CTERM system TPR-repeat protein PrsT [Gammaproteobacteria bacterium]
MKISSKYCLIFTVFLLSACGGDKDDKALVRSAQEYIEKNQLQEAYLELKNALQANPKNAEGRYLLGQMDLAIGDAEFAAKEFRKARETGWDEGEAEIGLMRAWKMNGEFQKILDEIEIKDSYKDTIRADMYGLRAFAEMALGYAGLAKVSMAKGREIDANALQVAITSIQIELASGGLDAASLQLNKALAEHENNAELLLLSAAIALQNKDSEQAATDYRKIVSLEPKVVVTNAGRSARVGLVRLEIINKNMQQAKDLLKPLRKQRPNDPAVNYLAGLLAYEEKDLDKAEELLLNVLKAIPDDAKTLLLFGAVNFAQKDYEQTAYYAGKYLQLMPGDISARKLLGRTYMLMGQQNEAQAILRPGLQQETDAELLALIGLSQLQAGDTASGISGLEKATQAAPESKEIRGELIKAYISAGQTDSAIKQLDAILTAGDSNNQAKILKVKAYLSARQYDQAINTALDILKESPEDVSIIALTGNVFALSGDGAEARKYYNQALKIAPENESAAMLLAALEETEGNIDAAKAIYKKLSSKKPASMDAMLALARLAAQKKDDATMVSWLEKAREQAPMDIRSRYALAEYYLRNKQFDKAGTLVEEALEISSKEPALLLLKSKILLAQQRNTDAVSILKELVTRSPKSIYVRTLLGETYMKLGQFDDARRQLNLALQQQPYYEPALLVLARTEQRSENYEQAMKYARQLQKVQPDEYMAYELIGDVSMLTKDYPQASEAYNRAVAIKPDSEMVIKQYEALMRLSRTSEAKDVLRSWLNTHPDDVRVNEFLGNAYLANGENTEAIQAFETVYKKQPDNIVALNNLAWLYSLKNDPKAIIFAEKAYKAKTNDGNIQDTYGWILVQQGQVEEGRRILEQAMKALPDVAEIRYHHAVAVYKSGEKIEAKKLLKRLLQDNPSFDGSEDAQRLVSQ